MDGLLSYFYYGSGAFCLGAAVAFVLILMIAARNTGSDDGEGCIGGFIMTIAIIVAFYLFYLALTGSPAYGG